MSIQKPTPERLAAAVAEAISDVSLTSLDLVLPESDMDLFTLDSLDLCDVVDKVELDINADIDEDGLYYNVKNITVAQFTQRIMDRITLK